MNLKPISPTTTLTNALPKMYDNWQEFFTYWSPWVLATNQKHLTLTQWENGIVNQYEIDWSHVLIMCHYEKDFYPFASCTGKQFELFKFLRNFWRKVGLPAG